MANMKIIKMTYANGDVWYRIMRDGKYVDGTLTPDEQKAQKTFDRLKSSLLNEEVIREEQV